MLKLSKDVQMRIAFNKAQLDFEQWERGIYDKALADCHAGADHQKTMEAAQLRVTKRRAEIAESNKVIIQMVWFKDHVENDPGMKWMAQMDARATAKRNNYTRA